METEGDNADSERASTETAHRLEGVRCDADGGKDYERRGTGVGVGIQRHEGD